MSRAWDAPVYDRISDPLVELARPVVDRLELRGSETVLDAGCGSGRVTELLCDRAARVIAVDADAAMAEQARARLGDRALVLEQDLNELDVEPVDAILSTATLHWIQDHGAVFARFAEHLRPGGRISAQCGGHGNIAAVRAEAGIGAGPWNFATPEDTERHLRAAGFTDVAAWLQPVPVAPDEPRAYLETIIFHGFDDAPELARRVTARTFDYVRLNFTAVRT